MWDAIWRGMTAGAQSWWFESGGARAALNSGCLGVDGGEILLARIVHAPVHWAHSECA
jgi:hypothetical protein